MKPVLFIFLLLLSSCAGQHKEIVAEVDGEEIFSSELSELTKQEIFDLLNMAYDIKSKALSDLIKQKILEKEAAKKGLSLDGYLNDYVQQFLSSDTDSIMKMLGMVDQRFVYAKNNLYAIPDGEMDKGLNRRNQIRNVLVQKLTDSLYNKAEIKKYLYPPKRPDCVISDLCVHYRGKLDAATYLIVASDYNCERCVGFEKTLKRIYNQYQDRVKFGYVNFADYAAFPALACEAADKQGKFWEFHDAVFQRNSLADSTFFFNFADSMGMNLPQFKHDLLSEENYNRVNNTINKLVERGLFATPTIIINDRLVYTTNSYEELTKLLNIELEKQK